VFTPSLLEPATGDGVAVDVDNEHLDTAVVLAPGGDGYQLGLQNLSKSENWVAEQARTEQARELGEVGGGGADLTRFVRTVSAAHVDEVTGHLTTLDLVGWTALGLALTSADLVGVMR